MSQVWFITGSSRGLGRAIAEAALAAGYQVVGSARNPESLAALKEQYGEQFQAVALDVNDAAAAESAIAAACEAFGRIDVLVNNAGYGFTGAFEEMTAAQFSAQVETNFNGVVNVTRAALPRLREQGSGHIFQVTSIGGRLAMPGLSGYHAAKFAVEGLSEALASEIAPLGVKMTIVEPGGFRTDWAGASMDYAEPMEAYAGIMDNMRTLMNSVGGSEIGDPERAAQTLLKVAQLEEAPLRLPLGSDALLFLKSSYQRSLDELDRWSEFSRSTDFEGADVPDHLKKLANS